MPEKVRERKPPKGLSRLFFRTPILLYRMGLGWVFGSRMILLNHVGRKTGLPRQAVLEVARHDKETDTYVINAGFGDKSDWYQNILQNPEVTIRVGRRTLPVRAERLPAEAGGDIMVNFSLEHPVEARIARMMGYAVDGTVEGWRTLGETMLFVALRPR
jgi:deazaflavin-dependent oxidoreductase (nitroreductase family)